MTTPDPTVRIEIAPTVALHLLSSPGFTLHIYWQARTVPAAAVPV